MFEFRCSIIHNGIEWFGSAEASSKEEAAKQFAYAFYSHKLNSGWCVVKLHVGVPERSYDYVVKMDLNKAFTAKPLNDE